MIERDKPMLYKYDWEQGEEKIPLSELYTEFDNVFTEQIEDVTIVYDFDDIYIMIQKGEDDIQIMNLLFAREKARPLYDKFYEYWATHGRKKLNKS